MREIQDRGLLADYLRQYELETIFYEPFRPHLSLYGFDQGEFICSQGAPAEYLYVLVSGKIKIYTTSPEGKTLILNFMKPLEIIGDIEYLKETDTVNTVEAVTTVHMIGIHHRWLRKFGQNYAPMLQFLLDMITNKFYIKSNFLSLNLMYPVEVRLASYLLSISFDDADTSGEEQRTAINLVDAASLIGTSYRHVNRVIQKFCKDGLVERDKGYIRVIDRKGLSDLAGQNIYEVVTKGGANQ
uniref:Crp/Fnr family transcriptional regulator n=1 Tax=Paenibacillus terrae TaxID=159743 RepID=UPI00119F69A3|nr:Crp/Fnr family transcriptional regulator [Paenibacillus terrae]